MSKFTNFGSAKSSITRKLTTSLLNKENITENEILFKEFVSIVKNSPILTLEFIVFNNLEEKYIADDISAMRYIDENITLFKSYTKDEILKENQKLDKFLGESSKDVYDDIQNLIIENSVKKGIPNIDKIHTSFQNVLSHIKKEKIKPIVESVGGDQDELLKYFTPDAIVKKAVENYNTRYSTLTETEWRIVKVLSDNNPEEKLSLYEEIKSDVLSTLNNLIGEDEDRNLKLNKIITTINETVFNEEIALDEITKLIDFKDELTAGL